jgi:hypothetical protein
MTDANSGAHSVGGQLNIKDLRRLTGATRSGTIGPVTTYYAGVTAPIISASMALLGAESFKRLGLDTVWLTLVSAIFACLAGIVWYLIFMRWAYRHQIGRAGEKGLMQLDLAEDGLHLRRGDVTVHLSWAAVSGVSEKRDHVLVRFDGAEPVLVPNRWFGKDKAACRAFRARLKAGGGTP